MGFESAAGWTKAMKNPPVGRSACLWEERRAEAPSSLIDSPDMCINNSFSVISVRNNGTDAAASLGYRYSYLEIDFQLKVSPRAFTAAATIQPSNHHHHHFNLSLPTNYFPYLHIKAFLSRDGSLSSTSTRP